MLANRRILAFAALQLAALAIGGGAAIAADQERSDTPVHAAQHCTRYAPIVQVDPPNCAVTGWMPVDTYQTPSTALRDYNEIYLVAAQYWTIYLFDSSGNPYQFFSEYGHGGSSGGVSGIYTKALCASNSIDTYGVCYTRWHD